MSAADRAEYVRLMQRAAQSRVDIRRTQERAAASLARCQALLDELKAFQKERDARKAADQGQPGRRRADD